MAKSPKRPKAPKASASLTAWENYNQRLSAWEKKVDGIQKDKTTKANLIKKVRAKISGVGRKKRY